MKRRVDFAKIRAVRKQKGLTQEQMARAIGYRTAIGYHYLEVGKRRITAEKIAEIAAILEVAVDDLYQEDPADMVEEASMLCERVKA